MKNFSLLAGIYLVTTACLADQPPEANVALVSQQVQITGIGTGQITEKNVAVLPLYRGYDLALTGRWDDNGGDSDKKMGEVFARHGYKATFSLTHVEDPGWVLPLIKAGHGIASHSITHPALEFCSNNTIFTEILQSRMELESKLDVPVHSFAFPFCSYCNYARPRVQHDIYRALRRSGYHHVADPSMVAEGMDDLSTVWILPGDGAPVEEAYRSYLKDKKRLEANPNIGFTMHAWAYNTPKMWSDLEQWLDACKRDNSWYCTNEEYASYRFQRHFAKVSDFSATGETVSFKLTRPTLVDAGEPVPLTLKITGADFQNANVSIDGAKCEMHQKSKDALVLSVNYPDAMAKPDKIDLVGMKDKDDASKKFPGLSASLRVEDGGSLKLALTSAGPTISNVRVTFRLPLSAQTAGGQGEERIGLADLAKGAAVEGAIDVKWLDRSRDALEGPTLFAAQVDFTLDGKPQRLHVAKFIDIKPEDKVESYAKGRFLALGPALGPMTQKDLEQTNLLKLVLAEPKPTQSYKLSDGKTVAWAAMADDKGMYDPNFLASPTGGGWQVLTTVLRAGSKQDAQIECGSIGGMWLDGKAVGTKQPFVLEAGAHRLTFTTQGRVFFRIVSPKTGTHLADIAFEPDAAPPANTPVAPSAGPQTRLPLTDWLACGAFPNPGKHLHKTGLDADYLASAGGEARIEPAGGSTLQWGGRSLEWSPYGGQGTVNLLEFAPIKALPNQDDLVAYACCYVQSPREQEMFLGLGSDDGYKLWVNHELIAAVRAVRGADPYEELYRINLRKGPNVVLLKVDQESWGYGFVASLFSPRQESVDCTAGIR
jgi:peptidoglycan/xylan/chitin deacetylase (PgdA/CDA1 family)